jgi:hypothetical protein
MKLNNKHNKTEKPPVTPNKNCTPAKAVVNSLPENALQYTDHVDIYINPSPPFHKMLRSIIVVFHKKVLFCSLISRPKPGQEKMDFC